MRVVAMIVVAVLLASVQCLSACTLASCAQAQSAPLPPCHKHHPMPSQDSAQHNNCDHQKAVDRPGDAAHLIPLALWAIEIPSPRANLLVALEPVQYAAPASPPGFTATLSVLRI